MSLYNSKVSDLNKARQKKKPDGANAALLATMGQIKRYLIEQLALSLKSWFDTTDDYLFAQSEQAHFGPDQSRYFETMRLLRNKRSEMENQFTQLLETAHQDFLSNNTHQSKEQIPTELGVLDNDEMDKKVALESIASKALSDAGDDWLAFKQRINHLTQSQISSDNDYVFSPYQVSSSFFDVIDSGNLEIKSKLLLLKLFEKQVVSQLPAMYAEANIQFVDRKVLPDLDIADIRKQTRRPAVDYSSLQKLMEARRLGVNPESINTQSFNSNFADRTPSSDNSGGAISPNQGLTLGGSNVTPLFSKLYDLQLQTQPGRIAETKAWLNQQASAAISQSESMQDADTINLVAMLFEFILEDEKLSPHMKQLIARLQIPVIKVALIDREFFSNKEHPCRQLLNQMAHAAIGWEETDNIEEDPLYGVMKDIIHTLNKDLDQDTQPIEVALEQLKVVLEKQSNKQKIYEHKLIAAEKARIKDELSVDKAKEFIEELLKIGDVHYRVKEMIIRHWHPLMRKIHLKFGFESAQWKNSAKIIRELLWSLQPGVTQWHSKRFEEVVPNMFIGLRQGLVAINSDQTEMLDLFQYIDNLHQKDRAQYQASEIDNEDTHQEQESQQESIQEFTEQVEEISEKAKLNEPDVDTQIKTLGLSDYVGQIKALEEGTWFELVDSSGQHQRWKLVSILLNSSKFIFANNSGTTTIERSLMGLAAAFREGNIYQLDDAPVLEKALNSVTDTLVEETSKAG